MLLFAPVSFPTYTRLGHGLGQASIVSSILFSMLHWRRDSIGVEALGCVSEEHHATPISYPCAIHRLSIVSTSKVVIEFCLIVLVSWS